MKNTFKILLVLLFTTTSYSLESNESLEHDFERIEKYNSIKCGFLEIKSPFRTDKIVRATKDGCFRWVYSKNGKITSIEKIQIKQGESKRGFSNTGETVEIRCGCRSCSVKPNH